MRDIEAVPAEEFARNLRRARHKFELMRRLGADTVLVCSSVSPDAVDDDALAAEQLSELAGLAEDFGVRVAYEALAWGRHVSTYDHAWRIVEAAGHPALGTCLDSFHILSRGSDPRGIEDIPGEKIFFLQLADAPLPAMDVLQWSRHHRCFPGQGGLDVAGLLRHVLRTGYDGPLSLEVFNDVFRQSEAGPTAVDAQRSLRVLQETVGLTTPPPPVVPTGVAFAELVTPDAAPVTALLGALGFARTGRHRSKPVDLWQRGDARVLVNTGPAGRRDGTRLAAVGLESPDPAGAARRAEALLAPVLPRRRAPGDAPLEAVAAPDGTELFFCATGRPGHPDWRADFTRDAPPPRPATGAASTTSPSPSPGTSSTRPPSSTAASSASARSRASTSPTPTVSSAAVPSATTTAGSASCCPSAPHRPTPPCTPSTSPWPPTTSSPRPAASAPPGPAAARPRQLPRRPRRPVRVRRRRAGDVPGAGHPLRPRRARRLPPLLHPHPRPRLRGTRPARPRLPRLRRPNAPVRLAAQHAARGFTAG